MFTHTAGASVDMNPEKCWMGCYEMYARAWILIGLSETREGKVVCFCSPQADDYVPGNDPSRTPLALRMSSDLNVLCIANFC